MGRDRREDEGQYYPGGKTIPVTPQHGGGSVVLDDTVTQNSQNGVKSRGIWSWVKGLLPVWLTPNYAEPATVASVNGKVDKISGKGLSSNDYTTAEKTKLAGIEVGAEVNPTPVAPSTEIAEGAFGDAKLIAEFVNSSINAMAAFYITKNATGDAFATKAELTAAIASGTFYNGGSLRTPTRNDYLYVLADESATPIIPGVAPTTRYSFDGGQWAFQIIVNNTALTSAQVAAINSGITAAHVAWLAAFKGTDTSTTLAALIRAISDKQDEISDLASIRLGAQLGSRALPSEYEGRAVARIMWDRDEQNWAFLQLVGGEFYIGNYRAATLHDLAAYLRDNTAEYSASASVSYAVGAFVKHNGTIHVCNTATTGGSWDSTKWTELSKVADFFSESNTKLTARVNSLIDDKVGDINDALDELNGEVA